MRQYAANSVILPPHSPHVAAYARGSVLAFSPGYFRLGVLVHEYSHILDTTALRHVVASYGYPEGTPFSRTQMWSWVIDNDTAVPTPYARSSLPEDFADAGRWAMSHITHRGGLAAYSDGWYGCRAQVYSYQSWLADTIFTPYGRCTRKVDTTEPLRVERGGDVNDRPESTLKGTEIKQIFLSNGVGNMLFVYQGPPPEF